MSEVTLLGIVWGAVIIEMLLCVDLYSPKSKIRKKVNWLEYKFERNKYEVYPLRKNTLAWKRIEDIPNFKKAQTIDLDKESQKLIASLEIQKNAKKYWKVYIICNDDIQIRYVEYDAFMLMKAV